MISEETMVDVNHARQSCQQFLPVVTPTNRGADQVGGKDNHDDDENGVGLAVAGQAAGRVRAPVGQRQHGRLGAAYQYGLRRDQPHHPPGDQFDEKRKEKQRKKEKQRTKGKETLEE